MNEYSRYVSSNPALHIFLSKLFTMKPNEGIRTGWLSFNDTPGEVRKNEVYLSIQLAAVQYKANANWWQKKLGGSDSVALTTAITYRSGNENIESVAVQHRSDLKTNSTSNLALNKMLVEKIPATADALSIEVKMSVMHTDRLKETFTLLQRPEYQPALELTPKIVGQVLTISSIVKQLLTEEKPTLLMFGSYAGILPATPSKDPLSAGHLSEGWLFFIDPSGKNEIWEAGPDAFTVRDLQLYLQGKRLEETYVLLRITADGHRGVDERSNWNRKYMRSLQELDSLRIKKKEEEQVRVYNEAIACWMEGNVLLETDQNYIEREKTGIMQDALNALQKKYVGLGGSVSLSSLNTYKEHMSRLTV
jgi:hypothetical protein